MQRGLNIKQVTITFNMLESIEWCYPLSYDCRSQNLTSLTRYPSKAPVETAGGRSSDNTTPQKLSHFKVFWVKTVCVAQVACFLPWLKCSIIFESLWATPHFRKWRMDRRSPEMATKRGSNAWRWRNQWISRMILVVYCWNMEVWPNQYNQNVWYRI